MSTLDQTTISVRAMRLRARLPRIAAYTLVAILCVAGLKAIVKGPPETAAAPPPVVATEDVGAESFAEGFARAYLTWTAGDGQPREDALSHYLPDALGADGGLDPLDGSDQAVAWSAVVGRRDDGGGRALVTVAAQVVTTIATKTTKDTIYLAVPVARDGRGFLYVANYPAIVGPPATTRAPRPKVLAPVDDDALTAVVTRALTNYLSGVRANLLADLTPDAVVSLPAQRLRVTGVGEVDWVRPGRRVAVEVDAQGPSAGRWTLHYELEVRRRDRWYVQSLQVDPAAKGAR